MDNLSQVFHFNYTMPSTACGDLSYSINMFDIIFCINLNINISKITFLLDSSILTCLSYPFASIYVLWFMCLLGSRWRLYPLKIKVKKNAFYFLHYYIQLHGFLWVVFLHSSSFYYCNKISLLETFMFHAIWWEDEMKN